MSLVWPSSDTYYKMARAVEMVAMVLNLGGSCSMVTSIVSVVRRMGSGGALEELDVLVQGKRI